ncbi:DNA polymerase III subunit gamma/tau [Pseudahrensia aquimaris]|uniref:DNA polymerase III subunit gamma/tau n=1 Tax=Pseudahrensia aquimaris TaxID=744461 RepID=A0ABW3FFY2_9HYPH
MSDTIETASSENAEYRVLARKYRPANFDDLIGQEPMVRTLSNAFETGRIAQAYMLTGVRGVGKTTTARILARALNYEADGVTQPTLDIATPGVHCPAIMEGSHVDVIEMDAASHTGIGDIREIIASVRYKPVSARYKVYIIDEVHMLSTAAFNGLLKTLEEPPEHVKFIFATTEIRKVPITVLSRCQRFDLRRIDAGEMTALLSKISTAEKIEVEDTALAMIARAGEGSVRDALSLLDQAIAHAAGTSGGKVMGDEVRSMLGLADRARVIDLFEHIMKGDIVAALAELKDQYDTGADPATVLTDLADFVHFVTRVRYVDTALDDPSLSPDEKSRGKAFAEKLSPRILGRTWQMLLKGIDEVQSSPRPVAAADMVLVRLTHAADLPSPEDALKSMGDGPSPTVSTNGTASSNAQPPQPNQPMASAVATQSNPGGNTTMRQANGPSLVVDNTPEPAPQPEPVEEQAPAYEVIATFEELLEAAERHRDIRFKMLLRNNVSLISFAVGHIELNPVGNAPRDMVNQISARLKEWTGENWMITVSEAAGAETIKEIEDAEREALVADAQADPVVNAVLRAFPKSKILDIRVGASEDGLNEADVNDAALANPDEGQEETSDSEDPGAGGLDDYFN